LRSQLGGVGFDVVAATSPVQAAALVLRERPSAIILDMVMPLVDCADVIKHVRVHDPNHYIPIILYSGQPMRRLQEAVVRYGVNGCAPKKRDVTELLAELERCLHVDGLAVVGPTLPGLTLSPSTQTLFVDDDASVLRSYQRWFGDKIDAAFVTSPLDALARLHNGTPPRFVVADIIMPGMSGLDLYARALSLNDGWKDRFVFVTGTDNWLKSRDNMHVPVLQKPVNIQRLHEVITARP
jgi:CheY-like chemotaxis protein